MSEIKTHAGGCHCGRVRYEVDLDLSKPVIACNCSMCGRAGTLLTFVPTESFRLLSGEAVLREYKFNHLVIQHLFCGNCGIKSFARGKGRDGGDRDRHQRALHRRGRPRHAQRPEVRRQAALNQSS